MLVSITFPRLSRRLAAYEGRLVGPGGHDQKHDIAAAALGAVVAAVIGAIATALLVVASRILDWWPIEAWAQILLITTFTPAVLGAWLGPRLRGADGVLSGFVAIAMAIGVVGIGGAVAGVLMFVVAASGGELGVGASLDLPALVFGPLVIALLALFYGAPALLIATPAAVIWAEVVRRTLR
jgi:hypothetical protein